MLGNSSYYLAAFANGISYNWEHGGGRKGCSGYISTAKADKGIYSVGNFSHAGNKAGFLLISFQLKKISIFLNIDKKFSLRFFYCTLETLQQILQFTFTVLWVKFKVGQHFFKFTNNHNDSFLWQPTEIRQALIKGIPIPTEIVWKL